MTRGAVDALPGQFLDVAVIYPSEQERGKWVAHSLMTDQIGVGECVLDAFVELRKAVHALLYAAREDPSIQVLRSAPREIQEKLIHAKKLPDEIVEIADMQLMGRFRARLDKPWKPRAETLSASIPIYV